MKILVVDDEPLARSRLRVLIHDLGIGMVIGEASNGHQAVEESTRLKPDLVFMDVRMPGMDGIDAAAQLRQFKEPPAIVFTTAYDEYALQAFDVHAVDYLVKPVRSERLREALQRALELTTARRDATQGPGGLGSQSISVRVQDGLRLVDVNDVYYFLADHKYVVVGYVEGEVLVEESLRALEERFSERFIRIHRNALVAASQLLALERTGNGQYRAVLRGTDQKLDVSRRHLPLVREFMSSKTSPRTL